VAVVAVVALVVVSAGIASALGARSANANRFMDCEGTGPRYDSGIAGLLAPPRYSFPYHCDRPGPAGPPDITGHGGTLVAFGDSFSAGEGAPTHTYEHDRIGGITEWWVPSPHGFFPDSDTEGNSCHRSAEAWPARTASSLDLTLDFRACSGAVSQDYFNRAGEGGNQDGDGNPVLAQREARDADPTSPPAWSTVPAVPDDTRLMTVSMGGNNVHFADVILACIGSSASVRASESLVDAVVGTVLPGLLSTIHTAAGGAGFEWRGPESCLPAVELLRSSMDTDLGIGLVGPGITASLLTMFQGMRTAADATGARVIVLGYPRMFPTEPTSRCSFGTGEPILGAAEQTAINDFVHALNERIGTAASQAGVDFVSPEDLFVPPGATAGSLEDHGFCQDQGPDDRDGNGERWINRFILTNPWTANTPRNLTGHPNAHGYAAETELVLACYRDRSRCSNAPSLDDVDWSQVLRERTCGEVPFEPLPADVRSVTRHDVDGDGREEAFVVASCGTTTSTNPQQVYVFDGASADAVPTLIAVLGPDGSRGNPYLRDATTSFDADVLTISADVVREEDARCCPGGTYEQRFTWDGASFRAAAPRLADAGTAPSSTTAVVSQTPTGNIQCAQNGDSTACRVVEHAFDLGGRTCGTASGAQFSIAADGSAGRLDACISDVFTQPAETVPYGESRSWGAVRCTFLQSGVTCAHPSGVSFTISRAAYSFSGPAGTVPD